MQRVLSLNSSRLLWIALVVLLVAPSAQAADSGVAVYAGGFAAGRLFTAVSAVDRNWVTPDGRSFRGTEIRAEVEETLVAGLRIQKAVGPKWGLTLNFSAADADVSVIARTVQANVDKRDWDQAFIVNTELTAFYDLIESGNTAYVFGGAGFSLWSGEGASGLDQSSPALVVGLGYRIRAIGFDIDFEARDSVVLSNFDDVRDRLGVADSDFDSNGPTHLWNFTASWTYAF
jgi:hypothetical protein